MGDFGDIFDQLFGSRGNAGGAGGARGPGPGAGFGGGGFGGAGAGPRSRPQPQRGADVEHPVTLTFAQAARGTTLPLQINRDGRLETIDIKIPAGVKDGSRVRIKGKGQDAPGAESGDLFIVTTVHPHPYYRRDGLDILMDVPVSLYEALLGTKVDVPTLEGSVTLSIPPGTASHAKLRIKGRGIHRGEEKGDQLCVVKIVLPKTLDDEDREQVRKLEQKHPLNPRADVHW
ncbi:MAG TPA: J domain-containing protein, partial [Tepidisphaeraceae bacterium]|nr:J domain-containing protein [Tepidisphaeraceae bacterium]